MPDAATPGAGLRGTGAVEGHQCLGQLPQGAGPRGTGRRGAGQESPSGADEGPCPPSVPTSVQPGPLPLPAAPALLGDAAPTVCPRAGRLLPPCSLGSGAGLASSSPTPTPEPVPVGGPKCVYFPDLFSNKKEKGRRWRGGLAGPRAPCAPGWDGPHSACGAALEDWGGSMGFGGKQDQTSASCQSPHWQDFGATGEWSPSTSHQEQLSASKEQASSSQLGGCGI